jgi:nucleotide-binding universal stress UspA family protein
MRRIVVGVDGSAGSGAALTWATRQAELTGADLEVVLAFGSELAWIDIGADYEAEWRARAAQEARATLGRCVGEIVPSALRPRVHQTVVDAAPAAALVATARDADLLVVGSRGRGAVAGLLLGSVSRRCTEQAPCPVVVVPSTPT